jgi:Alginate export
MKLGWSVCVGALFFMVAPAAAQQTETTERPPSSQDKTRPAQTTTKYKTRALDISINWRARVEGWDWFEGSSGNNNYALGHSLLRIAIGQGLDRVDWQVEAAQDTILGLPTNAVVAAPQGQLGLGGTYYAANGNSENNASAFVKQAFVRFKDVASTDVKIGRFEYFDGLEVKPSDPSLATLVQTRIAHRLISNFGFSAVQRSFDGAQVSWDSAGNNLTFLAARPTRGVFQVDGNGELDIDVYYGAFTKSMNTRRTAGELRVFGLGYIDHRTTVLKTDNRSAAARAADTNKIEIATFGADYAGVLNTDKSGKFDVLGWGALQIGSWGSLTQRAGAFVAETGWQPPIDFLRPWLSAGYSFGSGDGNPADPHHGTFFQVLTTPRLYARFPFYNMMNNEDVYGTLDVHPTSKLSLRSEVHSLRLANAADLWYLGGGAFQRKTFGYTGRPSNGERSLANVWDLSADYKFTRTFSTTLYYGHAWGKSVVASIYPNNPNGQLVYLETNVHF